MNMKISASVFPLLALCQPALCDPLPAKPNVVLIVTDDQGYGDLGAHGHPHLKTPNMDRLHEKSVRLESFHVDPTCAPTRAALLTGRYSGRVGVWHTVMGRNLLREDETTLGEVFQRAGYRTAIFGKWHLGDTYPYAPRFRGFDDAIVHYAGGIGQTPDYWGNDYFDAHFNANGTLRRFQGYCTDVWFGEALRFMEENRENPFFLYLPLNAPHQTRRQAPERFKDLYRDVDAPEQVRTFWAMISNIDHNLGVLMERLAETGMLDHTILVFMSDNGTAMGHYGWPGGELPEDWAKTFNAGMRGSKGFHYDGGHRVPCFIYYPPAGIEGGRSLEPITAHIDLMPTLMELCGIPVPDEVELDGISLVPLLKGRADSWPDRTIFLQNQRVIDPVKWRNTAVMTDRWRLVDDRELYDIRLDPGQRRNVIEEHPDVARLLRREYDRWWEEIRQRFHETTPLYIGTARQNPVQLNAHDWMNPNERQIPWNQPHVEARPLSNGPWQIRVARGGRYVFTLRERPEIAEFPLTAVQARLRIGSGVDETKAVPAGAAGVRFEVDLPPGDTEMQTWLIEPDGTSRGAYYVEALYQEPPRGKPERSTR